MKILSLAIGFVGLCIMLFSLFLLYLKRIPLQKIASNPEMSNSEFEAELGNVLKIRTSMPAVALISIGLILVIYSPTVYPKYECFDVTGIIKKSDNISSSDIQIYRTFPQAKPHEIGQFTITRIVKDENDLFPTIAFEHPEYSTRPIDLNKIKPQKGVFDIGKITMQRIPEIN